MGYNVNVNQVGWDDDGRWIGPPRLGVFLRANSFFVAFWYLVVTGIVWAVLVDVAGMGRLWAFLLALVLGAPAALCFMFAFSRGWVAE